MKKNNEERLVDSYSPKDGLFDKFLGVRPRKQKSLSKSIAGYKSALFCKAVSEVLKEYDVRTTFDVSYGSITSPTYKNLQVSRESNEELLVSGVVFLLSDTSPMIFNIYPGWGTMELNVMYRSEDSSKAIELIDLIEKHMFENNFHKGEKINAAGQFLPLQDLDFDAIVLPEDQKQKIKMGTLDFFNKKDVYLKAGIEYKRGLIITGVPGTGKTYMGKILMSKADSTFIWATSDVVDSSSDIKRLFKMASELQPSIIFIEDMDDALESQSIQDTLKTTLDGLDGLNEGIVTVICTNHPDRLPMSLLRPGRFDDVIILSLPDVTSRLAIVNKVSEHMDIENREVILKELSESTEGFTPAQLKEVLVYSLLLSADANRETIIEDDIAKALIKINETQQIISEELRDMDVKSFIVDLKKDRSK